MNVIKTLLRIKMNTEVEINKLKAEIEKIEDSLQLQTKICFWLSASTGIILAMSLATVGFVLVLIVI